MVRLSIVAVAVFMCALAQVLDAQQFPQQQQRRPVVSQQQARVPQQSPPAQKRSSQQQQQRVPSQQRPQGTRRQPQKNVPANVIRPELQSGDLRRVSSNINLLSLDDGNIDRFLANEQSVIIMTDCFIDPPRCKSPVAANLVAQVRKLGLGGKCEACSGAQQAKLHAWIYKFVFRYLNDYPEQWRRALPHIGSLIHGISLT